MKNEHGKRLFLAWCFAGLGLLQASVEAATLIPPKDLGQIAKESDVVVLARAQESKAINRGNLIFTYTAFSPIETVGGTLPPGETFVVETPGGTAGGSFWLVEGTPRFKDNEVYLLFVDHKATGVLQTHLLAYGLLQRFTDPADGIDYLRPLPEAQELEAFPRPDGNEPEPIATYDEKQLLFHLAELIRGGVTWDAQKVRAVGRQLDSEQPGTPPAGCVFFGPPDIDKPVRWPYKTASAPGRVSISAAVAGDTSLAGGGYAEVQGAIGGWMGITGTSLDLAYSGTSAYTLTCTGGYDVPALGNNLVVFNDPCGDIADLVGCGGILALGGPLGDTDFSHTFDGTTWYNVLSQVVVVNNGAGCLGNAAYQVMMTHELGHGIGFQHFTDASSIMYSICCAGMSINAADQACTRYLYPECLATESRACGVGQCAGTQTCSAGGSWNACNGSAPVPEACNGLDDDCDGTVPANEADGDGDLVRVCAGDCDDGNAAVKPGATEACNGVDDDCVDGVPANEADGDGDLVRVCAGDCDDGNAAVKPGATEACNGVDDDCVDGVPANEADGDGDLVRICAGDCDDGNAAVKPGATELCNGVDDNCDGVKDEGCTCNAGETRPCGSDVGTCQPGTETCVAGSWGSCEGGVQPVTEVCNGLDDDCDGTVPADEADTDGDLVRVCAGDCDDGNAAVKPGATELCNGVDDNCDGVKDEGCGCNDAETRPCGSDVGACEFGTETCAGGSWGACEGGVQPVTEVCNGLDDDCEGTVPANEADGDGDSARVCGGDCDDGNKDVKPGATEICNDVDDNCNGVKDEGCACTSGETRDCGTDVGACEFGTQTCTAETWGSCEGGVKPVTEVCNGLDDDCDGVLPTNEADADGDSVRVCGGDCDDKNAAVKPGATEICNGVDDNCDGVKDEGCGCTSGETRACGTDVGVCEFGTETCAAQTWGPCAGGVEPREEICGDALDNDCDNQVDEDCPPADGNIVGGCQCSSGEGVGLVEFGGLLLGFLLIRRQARNCRAETITR